MTVVSSPLPLPLLISGIPGVPGYNALHYFRAKYPGRVFGIRQADNTHLNGPAFLPVAQTATRSPACSTATASPRCWIAPATALKACELNPELARRINVNGVRNLLAQTVPRGIRLVHLSVDLVFSGDRGGGYVEDDPPDPVTVYGKTMAASEQVLLEVSASMPILKQ